MNKKDIWEGKFNKWVFSKRIQEKIIDHLKETNRIKVYEWRNFVDLDMSLLLKDLIKDWERLKC